MEVIYALSIGTKIKTLGDLERRIQGLPKVFLSTRYYLRGATENARHENAAQGKMQGWKMQEWKIRHKTAGLENARLENTAQEIPGWKMREKSVWKANRRFIAYSIKWIIVYWHNKNKHVVHIFRTTVYKKRIKH